MNETGQWTPEQAYAASKAARESRRWGAWWLNGAAWCVAAFVVADWLPGVVIYVCLLAAWVSGEIGGRRGA